MKLLPMLLCGAGFLCSLEIGAHAKPTSADELAGQPTNIALAQSSADLERQRAAEQAVKDAERIRQENRNTTDPNDASYRERQRLEERTNREVERLRQGVTNPQQLQQSQSELQRLRQDRYEIDHYYRWDSYYYNSPYYPDNYWEIPNSNGFGTTEGNVLEHHEEGSIQPINQPPPVQVSQNSYQSNYRYSDRYARESTGTFSISTGFKDGIVNPAIGYRLPNSNIGFEVGAVFNQDQLPAGTLNEYPAGSLMQQFPNGFNNLGTKKLTPNIGGDVIGYFDTSPQVSLYGGFGVYFQSSSQIVQSKATTDLFKETNDTNVNVAVSGGADFRVNDSLHLGAGYHSIRGVTARIGYEF